MPIGLRFELDKLGNPNGIQLPFTAGVGEEFAQSHLLLADTEVEITIPTVIPNDEKVSRIYFNGPDLTRLAFYLTSGKNFPTAGVPTDGFVIDPGVIVIGPSINSFFLKSNIQQTVTVFMYSAGNK